LNKRVKTFNVGANASIDINNINTLGLANDKLKINNSVASVNPYVSLKGTNYTLSVGANIVSEFGDESRFNIFPSAEVDFSLVPSYLHLFGGLTGGVKQASYKTFANQNPYLGPQQTFQNMIERLNIYGGIKGNAGATFGYKAKVMYKSLENMPLYVNNPNAPFQFQMVYDGNEDNKVKYVGIEGEINVRLSELVNVGGRLNIDGYTMATENEAWFTPKVRLAANARFNISEKLYIDAEALFHGLSYAKSYKYDSTLSPIVVPDSYTKATVPEFFDLSAGAEYKAMSNLGVFIKVNNIFNAEYERYLYYPKLGFNMIGGVNFSF